MNEETIRLQNPDKYYNALEKSGVVKSNRKGKYIYYKISDKKIVDLIKLLEK